MKKVLIIGAGESGLGCALLANKYSHEVFVSDIKQMESVGNSLYDKLPPDIDAIEISRQFTHPYQIP